MPHTQCPLNCEFPLYSLDDVQCGKFDSASILISLLVTHRVHQLQVLQSLGWCKVLMILLDQLCHSACWTVADAVASAKVSAVRLAPVCFVLSLLLMCSRRLMLVKRKLIPPVAYGNHYGECKPAMVGQQLYCIK